MGIVENTKEIVDLVKKVGDADLYRRIVELEHEVFQLSRENLILKKNEAELQDQLRNRGKMRFQKPFYYNGEDQDPYCPRCWDASTLAVHLFQTTEKRFDCPNCKQMYLLGSDSGSSFGSMPRVEPYGY
jgi:hypothetical protein